MSIKEILIALAISILANILCNSINDGGTPRSINDSLTISVKLHISVKPSVMVVFWIISLFCVILGLFSKFH